METAPCDHNFVKVTSGSYPLFKCTKCGEVVTEKEIELRTVPEVAHDRLD